MNKETFQNLKPGDVIEWPNKERCVILDERISRKLKGAKPGEWLRMQFLHGGCSETLNRYENTGIDWSKASVVTRADDEHAGQSTKLTRIITAPEKFTLPVEFIYEPGNGTRFDVVMMELANSMLMVALPNFKACYWFLSQVSPGYVEEKLRQLPGDAEYLADLINAQLDCPSDFAGKALQAAIDDRTKALAADEAMGKAIAADTVPACGFCDGTGKSYHGVTCKACKGTGKLTPAQFAQVQKETEAKLRGVNYAHHDEGDDNR